MTTNTEKLKRYFQDNGSDINRYCLLTKFDHYTNNGNGIYKVTLIHTMNDTITNTPVFMERTHLLGKFGLAKMNRNKTSWVMVEWDRANLELDLPDLQQLRI